MPIEPPDANFMSHSAIHTLSLSIDILAGIKTVLKSNLTLPFRHIRFDVDDFLVG